MHEMESRVKTARHIHWLYDRLPGLIEAGVLDESTALRLREHFGEPAESPARPVAIVLFSVLGATLVGGGVILLLAHNWPELSRPVRSVIAIVPLLISLGFAAHTLWRRRGSAWREGVSVGWILSLGAALALIEQTYQIGGGYETFMLRWLLLAMPVPWLLRSVSGLCLYLIGLAAWVPAAMWEFESGVGFWGLLLLVAPLLVQRFLRHREKPGTVLLGWTTAGVLTFSLGLGLSDLAEELWPVLYAILFGSFLVLGGYLSPSRSNAMLRPFRSAGVLGTSVLSLILSYEVVWQEWLQVPVDVSSLLRTENALQLLVAALLLAGLLAFLFVRRPRWYEWLWLAAIPVITLACLMPNASVAQLLLNAYLFVLGVGTITHGFRSESLRYANAGMAVLAALILARFFDSDVDMVIRGLVFIILGLGFFAVNWLLIRRQRLSTGGVA